MPGLDSMMPETEEETTLEAKSETTPAHDVEQQQQEQEQEVEVEVEEGEEDGKDDNVGMLVLAGSLEVYDPDEPNVRPFDIVAVHGLYGHHTDTWTTDATDDAPARNWLIDQLYGESPGSRILTFGYDASVTKEGISTMPGIRRKALQLLDGLVELRNSSDPKNFRPLVFIAHDLGGIIVKAALWIAALEYKKYGTIKDWTRLLIFFGCPHRCTSTQDIEDRVISLLIASKSPHFSSATRSIKELSRSIIEINGSFATSNSASLLSIVNVYSEEEDATLQIFDKYMATLDVAFEERIGRPEPHRDICKFAQGDDLYNRISQALGRDPSPLRPNDALIECLQTFQFLAAPVYPLESVYGPKHRFKWICQLETYTKWFDNHGPSILHVHGTTGASDAAEYVFQCLDSNRAAKENNNIPIYFAFNRNNDQCNSIVAMLNTFLAQILNHNQDLYDTVRIQFEQMVFHSSWTQAHLMALFQNMLTNWNEVNILCVINGLDECDDSRISFLKDLCSFARWSERNYKIVITSTADPDLQAALADWPSIDLAIQPEGSNTADTNLASDIGIEVLELVQQRPTFYEYEKVITQKLSECGQDKYWRRLVLNQLRLSKSSSTKSATQPELKILPPITLKDVFARILARVPLQKRAWSRKALSWILYAFRPLAIWELSVALAIEVDNTSNETMDLDELIYQDFTVDLDEVFGGMFIIKHNEVHFGHPDIKAFLLAADENVWYDVKETAQEAITNACLFYLSLKQVQDLMTMSDDTSPVNPPESPAFMLRHGFRAYAIKYWPRHYNLIPETSRPTKRVLAFVQNTEVMRCWAEAYWWFSNPINRTNRTCLTMLPAFAGLGLKDLVTKRPDLVVEASETSQDRALGLVEAARNAQVEVVRKLLLCGGYNQASLQEALVAGASCCDEAVLNELITYAAESFEGFEWPPALLCRAAQFGLENVVQKLLESRAPFDTASTFQDLTPLHLAARHGKVGIVKILLEHKISITAVSQYDRVPLHHASMSGVPEIVKQMLDAGADINSEDVDKRTATYFACFDGNYEATKILVEAGSDMGCSKQGDWTPLTIVASAGFIKCAKILLEKKANVEVEGVDNWTPLRYAAFRGNVELCRLFLENGANANTLSGGDPILGASADQGNLEVAKLLVEKGAAVDAVTSTGLTALQMASITGRMSVVTYLLDKGADVNHANDAGQTSIHFAAQSGFTEIVKLLIDKGADLHHVSTDGWTPIHLSYDHAETTRVLMENGADANRIANHYTPLFVAAANNYLEVVKVLLSFKPNLEVKYTEDSYQEDFTALTVATVQGHAKVVRLLLEAGANINHRTRTGNFPLQYAVTYNRENVLRVLVEYNPDLNFVDNDGDTALNCMDWSTPVAIATVLVNRGSNIEIRSKDQNTPLCKALIVENMELIKYLIEKKAEINVTDGKYGGPLHIACHWSNIEFVQILVAAGADVNLVDRSMGTPLLSACRCRSSSDQEKQESVIRYLINEVKVDVTIVGGGQGCALNAACGWASPEMVKLILEKGAKNDIKDGMGRVAAHFAAAQSLESFQLILDAGADVEVRDKVGRTALHWATLGGLIEVVERALSLSRGLVDQADIDGWTPLLWAARGCGTYQKPAAPNAQERILKLLLDRGADPCVIWKGLDQEWSPAKIARYHGADEAVVQLLMTKAKEKLAARGEEDVWNEAFHASREAADQGCYCDGCLSDIRGIRYKCEACIDFDFCYKCYLTRQLTHPDHTFKIVGLEYEPVDEKESLEEGSKHQDEDDDEDDDDDSDDSPQVDVHEDSSDEDTTDDENE